MHLVEMQSGAAMTGWNHESARLFAIDIAMTVLRRNATVVSEVDRQTLTARLHEARTLVVSERDDELGFLQAALEANLALARTGRARWVWLTAIDTMIPNPYRAALITTRNALAMGSSEAFVDLGTSLRDRLSARLDEGSLLSNEPGPLFLSA